MADEEYLTTGWKALIGLGILLGLGGVIGSILSGGQDPRIETYESRISELEKELAMLKTSGVGKSGGKSPPSSDMSIGE